MGSGWLLFSSKESEFEAMSDQTPDTTPTPKPTPSGFISDGYTLPFSIAEVPGFHVGLSGKRRPMTERQLQNFLASVREENNRPPAKLPPNMTGYEWTNSKIDDNRSKGIAAQLAEWDLTNERGESVLITSDAVSRINPPQLLAKLFSVVCGFADRPENDGVSADEGLVKN